MSKISMKPTGKVYSTFKSRNYKIYKAIAEYIDNSTQSYFDNISELKNPLEIDIYYDKNQITITDNAYGMDQTDLEEALKLGGRENSRKGRNQFGMGLKVASIWFTDDWRITTKKLGNKFGYKIDIKLNDLVKDIDPKLKKFDSSKNEHYTKIELLNLKNRRIVGKSAKKLKEILGTVYKRDIKSGKVIIKIKGEPIKPKEFEFYEHNEHGLLKEDIDFKFNFEGKEYGVKGIIGVRTKGSTSETSGGFSLYENERVIIPNWRETEIFKRSNSYTYQRLVGELDLINFSVTSDKENFDWQNGLKDEFIKQINKYSEKYSKISEKIRKRILEPDSEKERKEIIEIGKRIEKEKNFDINFENNINEENKENKNEINKYEFKTTIRVNDSKYNVNIKLISKGKDFICVQEKGKRKIDVTLNRNHLFLSPKLSNTEELENYVYAFTYQAIAMYYTYEQCPKKEDDTKFLNIETFWYFFNKILSKAGE